MPTASTAPASLPTWNELLAHRAYLVRFAMNRLHDATLAEDVVHDVYEALLAGRAQFGGRSALRTWLTGVLKHKIVDQLRRQRRTDSLDDGDDELLQLTCAQPGPDEIAEQRERLRHTLRRIDALPEGLRAVVQLRVLDEQSSPQVCRKLRISPDNLFVRLHRARKQLMC